jgi:hypothetical protein
MIVRPSTRALWARARDEEECSVAEDFHLILSALATASVSKDARRFSETS